ncbi:hypothetical protein CY34DRAFT_806114 [Suillus luteus UH-Slu-Lm8-n1]|uniref:Uncharacterized protein n=1 Tax=Suillus luteus UH-Slu-Lm8-n1 TaxID=930992 RepID=A0A0D0ATV4_9AGAM|nr:hypothetical protein CY34DRAFT_806114 [Suillus luteus UH-Slu-Lm8-n1]
MQLSSDDRTGNYLSRWVPAIKNIGVARIRWRDIDRLAHTTALRESKGSLLPNNLLQFSGAAYAACVNLQGTSPDSSRAFDGS